MKKYKKLRYTGINYLFSKRPKMYNTISFNCPTVTICFWIMSSACDWDKQQIQLYNSENFRGSMSKYLYLICERRYIGVKCRLRSQDPKFGSLYRGLRYNGVRYIGFLPIQV